MSYKRWLLIAIVLYGIGLLLGILLPVENTAPVAAEVIAIEEMAGLLSSLSPLAICIFIFLKNVIALLISFILSPFFCIVPVLALILNGGVIGLVSILVIGEESIGFLLAALLPHGIIELPAFFMGQAVALSFGTSVTLAIFSKEKRKLVLPNLKQNSKYLLISLALLIPAAIIETYVTPLFLQ